MSEVALRGQYTVELDATRLFIEKYPEMVNRARDARKRAVSFYGFHVGAAGLGVLSDEKGENVGYMTPGECNSKRVTHIEPVCAEVRTLRKAVKHGVSYLAGVTVVATADQAGIKRVNFSEAPTLPPCWRCNAPFHYCSATFDDTLLLTVGEDPDVKPKAPSVYQISTVGALLAGQQWGELPAFHSPNRSKILGVFEETATYSSAPPSQLAIQAFHAGSVKIAR